MQNNLTTTRRSRRVYDDQPSCLKCRQRMSHASRSEGQTFKCTRCNVYVLAHRRRTPPQASYSKPSQRPDCVKCRRRMKGNGQHKGSPRFRCNGCGASATQKREKPVADPGRPHCVKCQRPMQRNGNGSNRCAGCGTCVSRHSVTTPDFTPQTIADIPTPKTGEALLEFAASVLPAAIPQEIREDVRQQICLDLLTRTVAAGALLNRVFVRRRYISPAYAANSRYKFKSLDAPLFSDSSRTFGESLAG